MTVMSDKALEDARNKARSILGHHTHLFVDRVATAIMAERAELTRLRTELEEARAACGVKDAAMRSLLDLTAQWDQNFFHWNSITTPSAIVTGLASLSPTIGADVMRVVEAAKEVVTRHDFDAQLSGTVMYKLAQALNALTKPPPP